MEKEEEKDERERGLPPKPHPPKDQTRGTHAHHTIGAPGGFDPGVREILGVKEKLETLRRTPGRSDVKHHSFAELERVFIVIELTPQPA